MLEDIDREMEKRSLQGLVLYGESTACNPELHYLVRTVIPRGGVYVKKRGEKPLLLVSTIDYGSAKKGVVTDIKTYTDYDYPTLTARYPPHTAFIQLIRHLFREHGLSGRIALSGRSDAGKTVSLATTLTRYGYHIVGEESPTLLEVVMATKSRDEIAEISQLGHTVETVMTEALDLIKQSTQQGRKLVYKGDDLTIGKIKSAIRQALSRYNLFSPEDFIFSQGTGSADPHNLGDEKKTVRTGHPLVFDIYPYNHHGFCFDTTRTYVIGKAPPKIRAMHQAVLESQALAISEANTGVKGSHLMNTVCDHISKHGFPTVRDHLHGDPQAKDTGFIHSLGHGVGWTLSDRPFLGLNSKDKLEKGSVFTVEPGLYDPHIGGVRIEDVIALEDGKVRNLSHIDKGLEI